jgi:hypothetical protein
MDVWTYGRTDCTKVVVREHTRRRKEVHLSVWILERLDGWLAGYSREVRGELQATGTGTVKAIRTSTNLLMNKPTYDTRP